MGYSSCELTTVSAVSAIVFGVSHICFFIHFLRIHTNILKVQLHRSPRDVLTNKVPFRIQYVLNVYSYYCVLNAGLLVSKGLKLSNTLQVLTSDGHCINLVDWLDWYFHSFIDLSVIMWILAVNDSAKRIVLGCVFAMLTCGLLCELTDKLEIQLPYFVIACFFFINTFYHFYMFYTTKFFFGNGIAGLIRGLLGIVMFVWTLYPIMFITNNVIWRNVWPLKVRDSCIAVLYIFSKFGFNLMLIFWDRRFQKTISTTAVRERNPFVEERHQDSHIHNTGVIRMPSIVVVDHLDPSV
eukprot:c4054_g1_i1.p1 GENE.c4054_g1_i1~~c4054_g1_i1.p1  ORF type:complete len:296 (+),score=59.76 c4054_g1_i1:194-1081(+)